MFLISETYLKSRVNVSTNKSAESIRVAFENVTDFYVKDLLGIPLYDFYLNHVTAKTTLQTKEAELFDKIKLYFALMTHYEMMFDLFEITNKGNTQEDNQADIEVVKLKRNEVYNKAEAMKSKILDYLDTNRTDFPHYFSAAPEPVQHNSGFSPIVFAEERKVWIGG